MGMYGRRIHKNVKDQFYTNEENAKLFINKVNELFPLTSFKICIEPSAGTGNFLKYLPKVSRIGFDIDPKHNEIKRQNFFDVSYDRDNILVIGNPPFGRISSLAVKFFNHSANFAKVIAFIVPRTFNRISIQNKLHKNFHLVYSQNINDRIFAPDMAAKCVFQIWEYRNEVRKIIELPKKHKDWEFLKLGPLDKNNQPTVPIGASFALLAYGGNIGRIVTDNLQDLRPKSWHWIKTNNPTELIKRFKSLDYSIASDTVRQNSLGQKELIALYIEKYGE